MSTAWCSTTRSRRSSPTAFAPLVEHGSVVFFDDSQRNVDAARILGLTAARVTRSGSVNVA